MRRSLFQSTGRGISDGYVTDSLLTQMDSKKKGFDVLYYAERVFMLFPIIHGLCCAVSLYLVLNSFTFIRLACFLLSVYVLPVCVFRLCALFIPVKEGMNDVGTQGINGWVVAMRLQSLFIAIDVFERVLVAVPGLFSIWLRCWGSRVGKGIIWTPDCKIYDRYLLDIGDKVIIGAKAVMASHAVIRKKDRIKVFCKTIHIGKNTVIGGEVLLGPGANIGENCQVNARSIIWVNETIASNAKVNRCRKE